jgi:hypothetical protein
MNSGIIVLCCGAQEDFKYSAAQANGLVEQLLLD